MTIKIEKKITAYSIKNNSADQLNMADNAQPVLENTMPHEIMHEKIDRPDVLLGTTFKIKTPVSEHAFYVTINDYILNEGTDYEQRRPYEIFINSKNMEHFQWIVALTRVISAVFRKGGDSTFLVEELKSVFDPQGGYFKSGGKYMPSIIAELGHVIESHMKSIGMIVDTLDEHQQKLIFDKKQQLAKSNGANQSTNQPAKTEANSDEGSYPNSAVMCKKCHNKAVVVMDGCATCLNCGDSKCG